MRHALELGQPERLAIRIGEQRDEMPENGRELACTGLVGVVVRSRGAAKALERLVLPYGPAARVIDDHGHDVTERIAGYQWDLAELRDLLTELSRAMRPEVDTLLGLDGSDDETLLAG